MHHVDGLFLSTWACGTDFVDSLVPAEGSTPLRSSSLPCSPFRKSAGATANLRRRGLVLKRIFRSNPAKHVVLAGRSQRCCAKCTVHTWPFRTRAL